MTDIDLDIDIGNPSATPNKSDKPTRKGVQNYKCKTVTISTALDYKSHFGFLRFLKKEWQEICHEFRKQERRIRGFAKSL